MAEQKCRAKARLRNGVHCQGTAATELPDLHCHKSSLFYGLEALKPASKSHLPGKVSPVDQLDAKRRWVVGRYRTRTEATSAVAKVALQEDDL